MRIVYDVQHVLIYCYVDNVAIFICASCFRGKARRTEESETSLGEKKVRSEPKTAIQLVESDEGSQQLMGVPEVQSLCL